MFFIDKFFLDKIEKYKKVTLEESLKKVTNSKNKMICGKYSPSVFDMEFEEIEFESDNLKLYGWYIKQEGATKTLIFAHGRFNNRIFNIKFLQLFKDMDLKGEKYNIFMPDLRNSGKSDDSKTAFGYYFSKDILNSIITLDKKYGKSEYILYGFSQGAMGAALVPYLYEKILLEKDLKVSKLILDSPVSNIKELLILNAKIFGYQIPYFIMVYILSQFNKNINFKLNELRLSNILGLRETLIIQSEKDEATPYEMVKKEYEILKEKGGIKPIFKAFRKGQHVRIYLQYKWEYTKTIENFLNS